MFRQRGGAARPNQRRGGGNQGQSGSRFNHGNNRSNGSNHGNQKRGGGGGGRGGHHHTAGQKRGRQSYEEEEGEDEDVDEEEYDEEDDTKTKVKSTSREYDLSAALAAHASDDEDDGPSEYQQLMNSLRGNSSVAAASKKSSTETLSQKHAALLAKRKKEEEGREEEADEEEEEGEEEDAEMDYEDDEDEEGMEGEEDDEEEMDEDAEEEAEDDEDDEEQDARGPSKKRRVQTSEDGEEGEEGEVYEDEEGEDDEDEEIEPIEGDDQLSEEDSDDSDNEADSGKKGSSSKEAADHAAKEMQEPDLFYRKFSHGHVFTPSQTTLLNLDGNAFAKRFPFKRGPAVPGMSEMLFVAGEENLRTPMPLNETTAAISPAKPTLSPPTAPPTPLLPASMKEDFVQTVRSVSDESLRILPKLQETWKRFIVESRRKKLNKKAKRDGSSATKKSSYELELEREKELDEINQENNKAAEEESASAVAGESTSTSSSGSLTQATSKFCAPDCLCFLCSDFYSASQSNILSILTNYQDLILTNTTPLQAQTVHEALALHMVNHLTKSREQVLRHNLKISKAEKKEKDRKDELRKAKREWREDMNRYRAQQKQNKAGGEAEEASDEEAKSSASSKKQKKQLSAKKQAPLVAPPSTVPHSDPLPIPEYRDQGFTRPKILALFPTAKVAHEFVLKLLALTPAKNKAIQVKRKRFDGDFAYNAAVDGPSVDPSKPFDYKYYFDGKDNDAFRVGINFNMKSVQFYAPFYNSDIIIASPLGLRMITGSEGDKITEREYDFLSSIEMLYVDSFDVVASMQNLQHLLTVMELLNTIPFKTSYTDFARIREWNLNGTAKYQRQTIVCAAHPQVELHTFQKNYCRNVEGKFMTRLAYQGVLNRVIPAVKQIFQRIHCEKLTELPEARFDYFITTVLPQLKASYPDGHILLYIPSYFDYVRVRNYAKAKHLNAAYASEYTKNSELSRGRSAFFHGEKKFMLITERFHFFKRYRIRGTVHVVFYALPTYEQFYVDFVNLLPSSGSGTMSAQSGSVLALYSKFDSQELERIIGTQRATKLLQATNHTHMFC